MSKYETTHLAPSEIDRLRLQAFVTNSQDDMNAYYRAASLYFQYRYERAMKMADRIEELEAKLAKAALALDGMVGLFSADAILRRGAHVNMELYNARATLAELKGEDQR